MTLPRSFVPGRQVMGWLLAAAFLGLTGCAPRRVEFEVGRHHVRFELPREWQAFERDQQLVLRRGASQIVIADLGPAGPAEIRHEVEDARALWSAGRSRDARWRMRSVAVPPHLFETEARRQAFWKAWARVSGASEDAGFERVAAGFDEVLAIIAAVPVRDLDDLVQTSLADAAADRPYDVTARRAISIGGRDGLVVDTRDPRNHARERRLALVLNHGHLLALRTEWGDAKPMMTALDGVLESLQFGSAEPGLVSGAAHR